MCILCLNFFKLIFTFLSCLHNFVFFIWLMSCSGGEYLFFSLNYQFFISIFFCWTLYRGILHIIYQFLLLPWLYWVAIELLNLSDSLDLINGSEIVILLHFLLFELFLDWIVASIIISYLIVFELYLTHNSCIYFIYYNHIIISVINLILFFRIK